MNIEIYKENDKDELIQFLINIGVYEFNHGTEWKDYFLTKKYNYLNNGSICYIVRNNGRIIASCALKKIDNDIAELESFYIKRDFRGIGLSNRLYDMIIDFANKYNYKTIILCTHKEFEAAVHFYQKRGFILYDTKDNQGNIELFYKKELI